MAKKLDNLYRVQKKTFAGPLSCWPTLSNTTRYGTRSLATAFQGQGSAAKLLRALIEKSEQTGDSLYLETETERNVSMYEYFGFTVIKKIVLPIINLPTWEMTRGG